MLKKLQRKHQTHIIEVHGNTILFYVEYSDHIEYTLSNAWKLQSETLQDSFHLKFPGIMLAALL
jgi:hypothetical protein